ncbi:tetratricopeptide repeat protein [Leptospira barantonii]|nr:tetratricopeptide repeat protein [Leptospira barantonii]
MQIAMNTKYYLLFFAVVFSFQCSFQKRTDAHLSNSYEAIDMPEIYAQTIDYEKLSGSGIGLYFNPYRLNLRVPENISEISDFNKTFLTDSYARLKTLPSFYMAQFTHEFSYQKDSQKIKIFFPKEFLSTLKGYAGREKEISTNVIFAFYNTFDKTNYLFLDGINGEFSEESYKFHIYNTYMKKGMENNKAGQYAEAIQNFDKVISLQPENEFPYYNRGNSYNALKIFDRAIESYTKAISIDPNFTLAYMNRALVYRAVQKYDQALVDINKAVELDPGFHDGYYNKGLILESLKRYDESHQNFKKAYSLNKSNHDALIMGALSAYKKRDHKEAILLSNQYLKLYPKSGLGFYIRGLSTIAEGDKSKGCADLSKARNAGYEGDVCG